MDPSTTPVLQAPQRWEVKDPSKFYGKSVDKHKYGTIQLFLNKPYYLAGTLFTFISPHPGSEG